MAIQKIVLMGAGRAGWHLSHALRHAGIDVVQVFSRKAEKAESLAMALQSSPITDLNAIVKDAELYLLAVSDQAIEAVGLAMADLLPENALMCHTSGATPSTVLAKSTHRYGVFYPLQTFSTDREVDFKRIPICIDASQVEDQQLLLDLAQRLSDRVFHITDADRAILHVAAVFANNFPNYLFGIAKQLLDEHKLSFDLLRPLIMETAAKVQKYDPAAMQTGPAIRGDEATLQRHLQLLAEFPEFRDLYALLSDSIQQKS